MMNRRNKLITVVGMLAGFMLLCGCVAEDKAISLPVNEMAEEGAPLEAEGLCEGKEEDTGEQTIFVHVCGAVKSPGVVELKQGSRREDALLAAGGFSENACKTYVNLAALLEDGEQLYIPDKDEGHILREEALSGESLVNINTAGEDVLCTLPGIGSARAKEIIAYRQAHGDFLQKEDIMQVSGIKESIYHKLCDRIVVK